MAYALRRLDDWDSPGGGSSTAAIDSLLDGWLAAGTRARWITDASLGLLWANPAASRLMEQTGVVGLVDGQVVLGDPEAHGRLLTTIDRLRSDDAVVVALWRDRWLVIRVCAVIGRDGDRGFGLIAHWADELSEAPWADLRQVFGLTPTEVQVARRLVEGRPAEAIAQERGASLETVRTHIRRLYAKLGVDCRERLFSLLLGFRAG